MTCPHSPQERPQTAATDAGGAMDQAGSHKAVTGLSGALTGMLNGTPAHAGVQMGAG